VHYENALDVDGDRDEDEAGQCCSRTGGGDEQLVPQRGVVERHAA
jgi:hypothetical protein